MYGWIWRQLPGPLGVRITQAVLLAAAVLALLWFLVFPWLHGLIDTPTFGG